MRSGRPNTQLILTNEEKEQLEAIKRSRILPAGFVRRAKIVLHSTSGLSNTEIANSLGITPFTMGTWRKRFLANRIEGLHDELRSGRPRSIEDDRVAALINKALQRKPTNGTHWSVQRFAEEAEVSPSMAHRLFRMFGLQPDRAETFKLSTDPFLVEKVRDIVGLYLNPPDSALVLRVDEKSQIPNSHNAPSKREARRL